jgi:hypothetical protein
VEAVTVPTAFQHFVASVYDLLEKALPQPTEESLPKVLPDARILLTLDFAN